MNAFENFRIQLLTLMCVIFLGAPSGAAAQI